jgi:hypothetical protein
MQILVDVKEQKGHPLADLRQASAVGWVERSDTHHLMLPEFSLGIAVLNPTYENQ